MKYTGNILRRYNESGFTLIEVMLALAVAAIGMVAVLGLLPQGMQSARSAADNTISATIANNIFGRIRSQSFKKVDFVDLEGNNTTYDLSASGNVTLYFDHRGVPTNTLGGANNYYFRANVEFQHASSGSLTTVIATLVWPALATHPPPNTNIFITSVAAYP